MDRSGGYKAAELRGGDNAREVGLQTVPPGKEPCAGGNLPDGSQQGGHPASPEALPSCHPVLHTALSCTPSSCLRTVAQPSPWPGLPSVSHAFWSLVTDSSIFSFPVNSADVRSPISLWSLILSSPTHCPGQSHLSTTLFCRQIHLPRPTPTPVSPWPPRGPSSSQ